VKRSVVVSTSDEPVIQICDRRCVCVRPSGCLMCALLCIDFSSLSHLLCHSALLAIVCQRIAGCAQKSFRIASQSVALLIIVADDRVIDGRRDRLTMLRSRRRHR